ncbi:hypothetical protein M885DRAFT_533223 [Pelagophyceae sp. CCMP2097]|nr:hypothetical protein M885DRAFT_533223 [Pelagophyceae sp. CCMP2097]
MLALLVSALVRCDGLAVRSPLRSSGAVRGGGASPARRGVALQASLLDEFRLPLPDSAVVDAVMKTQSRRVSAADVAAAGGLDLGNTRAGLVQLAAVLGDQAALEVSESGELVFAFPSNVRSALSQASAVAAAREKWEEAKPAVFTAARAAFGVALFASIAIIFTAIFVLSSSAQGERRDDRDDRRRGGGGMFGGPSMYFGPSPFDVFFYRPYYSSYRFGQPREPQEMGILESIYSFVFGDGDPNAGRAEVSIAAAAAMARRNGGVLTAEQLAPLLDPPAYSDADAQTVVDESFVLQACTRLGGRPEVTSEGDIVYVFDDLQVTAGAELEDEKISVLPEERQVFSEAAKFNQGLAAVLGFFNLGGAAYLGLQLASIPVGYKLVGLLGAVQSFYPALLLYAFFFVSAPAIRYLQLGSKNDAIDQRNRYRNQWLMALQSGDADTKLVAAKKYKTDTRLVESSAYTTATDAAPQRAEADFDDFDKRLGR